MRTRTCSSGSPSSGRGGRSSITQVLLGKPKLPRPEHFTLLDLGRKRDPEAQLSVLEGEKKGFGTIVVMAEFLGRVIYAERLTVG